MTRKLLLALAITSSFVAGYALNRVSPLQTTLAQESKLPQRTERVLVKGHARGLSSKQFDKFTFTAEGSTDSFMTVPKGKKLVLTDIALHPQTDVIETITVNIASAPQKGAITPLTQMRIQPYGYENVSLCSGYVIPAEHSVVAFTNSGLKPGQIVSIFATGYLTDEQDKQE